MKVTEQRPFKRKIYGVFFFFLILFLLTFVKLPYYVTYPGDAEPLHEMIQVEDRYEEKGEFMLTTIRMGKANVVQYVAAHFNKYQEIFAENQVKRDWESEYDYDHRQLKVMEGSQQTATIVAYKLADVPIEIINEGVIVAGVMKDMPASKKLKVGDVITQVNGTEVNDSEQLLNYLKDIQEGESVQITFNREDNTLTADVRVEQFPEQFLQNGEKRYGIGIVGPVTKRVITTDRSIQFETNNIGGPSAGLMFTLEIYNQLLENDITKGYKIAGTGEIFEDGMVGAIGGIGQKVIAADNAGAEIFFAPVAGRNFDDAKIAAADVKTDMKIVPVKTIHEALDYLEALEPKS